MGLTTDTAEEKIRKLECIVREATQNEMEKIKTDKKETGAILTGRAM